MKKVALFGTATLALLTLVACSSGNSEKKISSEKALTEKKVESKKESSGWDASTKTFTNKDGVLKIDKAEKSTNFDGKPALKVYFTLTNKRKEAQGAQILFQEMARVQQKQKNTSKKIEVQLNTNIIKILVENHTTVNH